jgi:membrane associated rhomboid family serine protease
MQGLFSRRDAMATKVLIAINVAIFFLQWQGGPLVDLWLVSWFGLSEAGLRQGLLWQPLTHMFLHGNLFHLLVNVIALWFAGRAVELWLGPARLLGVFFAGGIVGGILQVVSFPGGFLIGASGGVSAVLLAFSMLEPEMRITALLFFVVPVNLKAKFLGYGVILVSLVLPLLGLDPKVGHFAHLGGALVGMGYALFLRKTGRFISRSVPPPIPAVEGRWHAGAATRDMDAILNKVLKHGLHSLTPQERATLEKWNRHAR